MKTARPIALTALLGALTVASSVISPATAAPAPDRLIVPGHSFGKIHLGHNGSTELRKLPRPKVSDAGMSQNRMVWVTPSTSSTLFVHTVANGALDVKPLQGVTITEINSTSPYFLTSSRVGVGSTLAQIKRAFPSAHRLTSNRVSKRTVIYDDARQGIAFEFERNASTARCIALTVYIPGNKPDAGHAVSVENVKNLLSL